MCIKKLSHIEKERLSGNKTSADTLLAVIYTLSRRAKQVRYNQDKKNHIQPDMFEDSKECYALKEYLLRRYFVPREIHIINEVKYLYFCYNNYSFHIRMLLEDRYNLKEFYINRDLAERKPFVRAIPLKECKKILNKKDNLIVC